MHVVLASGVQMVQVPAHSFLLDDAEVEVQAELESFWAAEYFVSQLGAAASARFTDLHSSHFLQTVAIQLRARNLSGRTWKDRVCLSSESLCVALLFAVSKFTRLGLKAEACMTIGPSMDRR